MATVSPPGNIASRNINNLGLFAKKFTDSAAIIADNLKEHDEEDIY